jgi:protein SCO1/2
MQRDLRSFSRAGALVVALWAGLNGRSRGQPAAGPRRRRPSAAIECIAPQDLVFRDEQGHPVRLGDYFGRVPVVLTFNYFDCPMLCPLELSDLLRAMRAISPIAGKDFLVLSVSIDPHDTSARAAEKQQWYVERYGRPTGPEGWHFLTGEQQAIDELTSAVGFHYQRDAKSGQLAHAAGIVVSTPEGRLSRYLLGLEQQRDGATLAMWIFPKCSSTRLPEQRHKSTNVAGEHVVTIARLRFQDASLRQPIEQ